jgi:BirA family transcriptional regulator, biotin operon repressor / biotin---[acetyl-CoA-carboxylase] ligase
MDINRLLRETFVVEVEHRDELGSTNDRAMQRAKQGASRLPLLVIADRQTAGRGRGGNHWWTGPGSLAFSLLLKFAADEEKEDMSTPKLVRQLNCRPKMIDSRPNNLLSLAAGVAVTETVKPLLPDQEVGIRWPNDVVAAGRKLAGILVEVLSGGYTVIGIGINTNNTMSKAPAELLSIAAAMTDFTGNQLDHTEIMIALLQKFEKNLGTLGQSPSQLASQVDALCLQRGKPLTLRLGNQNITGICRGVARDGALLLETVGGLRSFYSGIIIA